MNENVIELFSKLEGVAKEWREFSREINGLEYKTYRSNALEVRCYFAEDGRYTAVSIGGIDVHFHNPVQFCEITYKHLLSLESVIKDAQEFLKILKKEWCQRHESEILRIKTNRIEALKRELAELEGEECKNV